ncbi:MAG: TonB family protein [Desulfotignum sp.]|nr:TonB family protein [Desulfotignum sp.]
MTRILISVLAAVLIHGAVLFFVPLPATPPGAISPQDHGIAVQISHLSPEPEPNADPALAPDMPPVPRPEEKQPPEPVPDIEDPPPPSTQIKATPEPADITARKELMPKKKDLTLSPPPPEAHTPEPDLPEPVNSDPKPPDVSSSDNTDRQPRKILHQDRPETRKAQAAPTGMTASTAGSPDAIDPNAPRRRKEAVPLYKQNPPPRYPGNARRRGHAGTVMLMVFVSEKGAARQIRIFESSGYTALDRAAENAVAAWRFEPGTSDGVPTGMWVKIPITFEVNK